MPPSLEDHRRRLPDGPRGDLQHALFRVLKSLVFRGDPHSPMNDLPISQLKCLYIVREAEGQKMIDIAHKMEIGLPAVSQIVDRLVRRGLFERQPDPQDRRVVRVVLTETAHRLTSEADHYRQERMDATLGLLNEHDVDAVTRGLGLLAGAAERVEALEKASHTTAAAFGEDEGEPVHVSSDPLVELIAGRTRSRRKRLQPELLPTAENGSP